MGDLAESSSVAAVLVLVAVGFVVVVALVVRRFREPQEVRRLREAVRRARRERRAARRARARAVAPAEAAVRRERRRHDAAVRRATERVRALEDPKGPVLASVGPVVLHERVLVTPGGTVPVGTARASVVTSGGIEVRRRPTLTRAALGAAAFGTVGALGSFAVRKRERIDSRRVHLSVEAGAASVVVELAGDAEAGARRFADVLERTAGAADATEAARRTELGIARGELAALRGDARALAAALVELDRVRADPELGRALAAAESAYAAARAALRARRRRIGSPTTDATQGPVVPSAPSGPPHRTLGGGRTDAAGCG